MKLANMKSNLKNGPSEWKESVHVKDKKEVEFIRDLVFKLTLMEGDESGCND